MEIRQPLSSLWVQRILVLVIVLLAYASGYYHSLYSTEREKVLELQSVCGVEQ